MKKAVYFAIIAILMLALAACDKRETEITSMKDLKVSEDFTFQTVRAVRLVLNSVDAASNPVPNASFRIYRNGDKTILNAKTKKDGSFVFTLTVPSYERNLYLESDGQSITLPIPATSSANEVAVINRDFIGNTSKVVAVYSYFTPAENEFASICYEDMWPQNGDYDINDLVIDINVEEKYDEDTWELTNIIFKYKVRAVGATRIIGFATTLPSYIIGNGIPVSSNNLATFNADYNTVVFFNNARDVVPYSTNFFNTEHSDPYDNRAEIVHTIDMPVSENWGKRDNSKVVWIPWYSAPYNPFIYINNDDSYQIHLKHYPVIPGYADMAKFNTFDDNSDVTYPQWPQSYQNANYCPWAFYIAESVPYPQEKRSILNVFPQFAQWALSDGWSYQDWYLNYNENVIYNPTH